MVAVELIPLSSPEVALGVGCVVVDLPRGDKLSLLSSSGSTWPTTTRKREGVPDDAMRRHEQQ